MISMSEDVVDFDSSPGLIESAYDSLIHYAQDDAIRKKWQLMKALQNIMSQCDAIRYNLIEGNGFDADMVDHYIQYFGNIGKLTECFTKNYPLTERSDINDIRADAVQDFAASAP